MVCKRRLIWPGCPFPWNNLWASLVKNRLENRLATFTRKTKTTTIMVHCSGWSEICFIASWNTGELCYIPTKTPSRLLCYWRRLLWSMPISFSRAIIARQRLRWYRNWRLHNDSIVARKQRLLSSADNLCKQFGPRSGPKTFDTLIVILKEFFE